MSQNAEGTGREPAQGGEPGILKVLGRRSWLIALSLLGMLGVAYLYQARVPARYESRAQLLVTKKRPDAVPGVLNQPAAAEEYIGTQAGVLKSPLIADRAAREGGLDSLATFAHSKDVPAELSHKLTVRRDPKDKTNTILELSYQALSPDDARQVLDAVLRSYQEFLRKNYQSVSEDTLRLIVSIKDTLQKDLARKEAEYRDFRRKNPSLVVKGKVASNLNNEMLLNLHSKRLALQVRRAEIEGLLAAIRKGRKDGDHQELIALIYQLPSRAMSESGGRTQSSALEDKLLPALIEEQTLLTEYASTHPQVVAARKKVELAYNVVKSILQLQLEATRTAEESLGRVFDAQNREAQQGVSAEVEDEIYRNDITRLQQLVDASLKRLQEANVGKDFGGFEAVVVGPPTPGEVALQSNPLVLYPGAGLLGLVGGAGLALLLPVRQRRGFRTPDDVKARLGWPVVGLIPKFRVGRQGGKGEPAPTVLTYHQPQSPAAEAYRAVRTALFAALGEGHKVVQVTAPRAGDGASTLAANLAVSVAGSSKSTLLIDADLRRPCLHTLFGLSAPAGLASLLAEGGDPAEVIQRSRVGGLSILPCGPVPANPADLLASPGFKALLDSLRARYDLVVVATPPVLGVADAAEVATRVDGVLLTMRLTKDGPEQGERAREVLDGVHARVLGVVANAVTARGE